MHYNVIECGLETIECRQGLPPWEYRSVNILIDKPAARKSDMPSYEMRSHYQAAIEEIVEEDDYYDQIYCDGSLNNETGCAGAAVTLMNNGRFDTKLDIIIIIILSNVHNIHMEKA